MTSDDEALWAIQTELAQIAENLSSPNELDSNAEPANIVDGLFAIAGALDRLASVIGRGTGER